jgi:hypothetical protein
LKNHTPTEFLLCDTKTKKGKPNQNLKDILEVFLSEIFCYLQPNATQMQAPLEPMGASNKNKCQVVATFNKNFCNLEP